MSKGCCCGLWLGLEFELIFELLFKLESSLTHLSSVHPTGNGVVGCRLCIIHNVCICSVDDHFEFLLY